MNKQKCKQWLWFVGLYAGSLSAVIALSYIMRFMLR